MLVRCETKSAMSTLSVVSMWVKYGTIYPMSAVSVVYAVSAVSA